MQWMLCWPIWTTAEHASRFKRMEQCSMNRRLPRVEEPFTAAERKGGILRCPAFWRFGESQTLYKKSVDVCVCLIWIYCIETLSPATTGYGQASSVSTVSAVCAWNLYLGMWNVTLGCVFSKSLSYTVDLFRQVRCRQETVSPTVLKYDWLIDWHAHSCHSWSLIMEKVEFISIDTKHTCMYHMIMYRNIHTYSGYMRWYIR